jgi:hypothetical protein
VELAGRAGAECPLALLIGTHERDGLDDFAIL